MAVDKQTRNSWQKCQFIKQKYIQYIKICGYCALSPTILPGKRDRVWLQGWMRYIGHLRYVYAVGSTTYDYKRFCGVEVSR